MEHRNGDQTGAAIIDERNEERLSAPSRGGDLSTRKLAQDDMGGGAKGSRTSEASAGAVRAFGNGNGNGHGLDWYRSVEVANGRSADA
jgi:hypothetical protein